MTLIMDSCLNDVRMVVGSFISLSFLLVSICLYDKHWFGHKHFRFSPFFFFEIAFFPLDNSESFEVYLQAYKYIFFFLHIKSFQELISWNDNANLIDYVFVAVYNSDNTFFDILFFLLFGYNFCTSYCYGNWC